MGSHIEKCERVLVIVVSVCNALTRQINLEGILLGVVKSDMFLDVDRRRQESTGINNI